MDNQDGMLKVLNAFLISGLITFLALTGLFLHLQAASKLPEQKKECTSVNFYCVNSHESIANTEGLTKKMSAELPAAILESSALSKITLLDLFLAFIAWSSGIFFVCFSKNLSNKFFNVKNI